MSVSFACPICGFLGGEGVAHTCPSITTAPVAWPVSRLTWEATPEMLADPDRSRDDNNISGAPGPHNGCAPYYGPGVEEARAETRRAADLWRALAEFAERHPG